jgi:adenylate cyclase
MRRGFLAFGLLLLSLVVLYTRWHDAGWFRGLDNALFDLRLQLRPAMAPGDEVAILVIDDATLQRLGHWPPPRSALAEMFELLARAGATVVALDLLLLEPGSGGGGGDAAHRLVTAVQRHDRLVLAMAFGFAESVPVSLADRLALQRNALPIARTTADAVDLIGEPTGIFLPFRPLADHAYLGHVNVFVEPGGELRYHYPAIRYADTWHPSFPVQAAIRHRDLPAEAQVFTAGRSLLLGDIEAPLDAASRLVINPYGPPGTFRHHRLVDLLDGNLAPEVFRDRVVVIGATATGVRDYFGTAFHPQVSGVEILATVVDNLLTGRFIDRSDRIRDLDLALIVGATTLALGLFAPLPLPAIVGLALLLLALPLAVATAALIAFGYWLNVVFATLGVLGVTAAAVTMRWRRLRQRGQEQTARSLALERYVSPLLRARLAAEGIAERSQLAAILFCDLEGFTAAAEVVDPQRLQALLQRFYALIETTATAHGAVVAGYAGDGAMLILGLPEPSPEDPLQAIRCGEALLAAMPDWQTEARTAGIGTLNLCIGINYGRVQIGHVGGGDQIQLTATGDVVNVAARLQAETRAQGVAMLVSATTVEAARAQAGDAVVASLEALPPLQLRGRKGAVPVYGSGRAPAATA